MKTFLKVTLLVVLSFIAVVTITHDLNYDYQADNSSVEMRSAIKLNKELIALRSGF